MARDTRQSGPCVRNISPAPHGSGKYGPSLEQAGRKRKYSDDAFQTRASGSVSRKSAMA
ncbi:hypothetical protein SACS_1304 [Parasaccharibacter apium]|uniref:Uncharacterized protein n=1 Tax=Parasaccharibacter apium TaxID=1510841 RepID=A0A7U7J1H8_9PROT|nr:hypothetical protein SACS_1304 [Parasaccharibacter apium]